MGTNKGGGAHSYSPSVRAEPCFSGAKRCFDEVIDFVYQAHRPGTKDISC